MQSSGFNRRDWAGSSGAIVHRDVYKQRSLASRLVRAFAPLAAFVLSLVSPVRVDAAPMEISGARVHEAPEYTRAVFDTSAPARFQVFALANPPRVVIDLENARKAAGFM